ncbi:MAG: argininosuccinate synthase [Dehalococcoidia bacterium]
MAKDKVVLAYSGGLDTSVAIKWIADRYNMDVVTLTVDVGGEVDLEAARERALKTGVSKALVVEAQELFVKYFVYPALQAGAIYEGQYPLATALARPLIAKLLVDAARQEGATAVAHGCTGKGNDQVRFDVSVTALAPDLRIIAPAREWGMSREEEMEYAQRHNIPIAQKKGSPYSIDANLWGRSIECGILEDPWAEPPEEVYAWTKSPEKAPAQPLYLEIPFDQGIPLGLNGRKMDGVSLITELNSLAGEHGVGRIDHIENRLVGIKSREVYEAPAAIVLLEAHRALEAMTLSKEQLRFKAKVAQEYADLIYNGLWFTALHQDLASYVQSTQRHVTGTVRVKLHKGGCRVVGRKSPKSLYRHELATYDKGDAFDHRASEGFIHIWGLPVTTQAQVQLLGQPEGPLKIPAPEE